MVADNFHDATRHAASQSHDKPFRDASATGALTCRHKFQLVLQLVVQTFTQNL